MTTKVDANEMKARAVAALHRTWQAIGIDMLACFGESPEQVTLSGRDVQEAVASCGFKGGYPEFHGDDREAILWLDNQSEACKRAILDTAFPRSHNYGL